MRHRISLRPIPSIVFGLVLVGATCVAAIAPAQTTRANRQAAAPSNRALSPEERASQQREALILSRLRGIASELEAEQKMLERRLAYAAQLRQKGLKDENSTLLQQAEQIERQAFALYQKKVSQYEQIQVAPSATRGASPTPARASGNAGQQPSRRATQPRGR